MQCKMKEYFFSFYTAEVQPILSKDSANRMQCKMKEYFFSFCTAEVQAILFSRVRIFLPFLDPERETRLLKNARRETRRSKFAAVKRRSR